MIGQAVPEVVASRIRSLFARHPKVRRAVLFGSRAKGNFREGSDIDLALETEQMSGRELADIRVELDDEPIAHRVDLVLRESIPPGELLEHIERVGKIFYDRNGH
jgi:predicted nucleotidyltransferase